MRSIDKVLKLLESIDGERYVVVYCDYVSFRKIYSRHAKKRIENNEMMIILSYYETTDRVRATLNQAGVNVKKQEGGGFLVIMDSYAALIGFHRTTSFSSAGWYRMPLSLAKVAST
jgi:hypothetical protein